MSNMPPGTTAGDYDDYCGENETCGNCGVRMIDCRCGESWQYDPFEYYCEFDDEGD